MTPHAILVITAWLIIEITARVVYSYLCVYSHLWFTYSVLSTHLSSQHPNSRQVHSIPIQLRPLPPPPYFISRSATVDVLELITLSIDIYYRQNSTYHGLFFTGRGALAGTKNSLTSPPWRIDPTTHRTMSERSIKINKYTIKRQTNPGNKKKNRVYFATQRQISPLFLPSSILSVWNCTQKIPGCSRKMYQVSSKTMKYRHPLADD